MSNYIPSMWYFASSFCSILQSTANPKESKDAVGNSATKTRKRSVLSTQICFLISCQIIISYLTCLIFRSRPSPSKKIAKKLLLDEHAENEDDDCGHDTAKPRYALATNFKWDIDQLQIAILDQKVISLLVFTNLCVCYITIFVKLNLNINFLINQRIFLCLTLQKHFWFRYFCHVYNIELLFHVIFNYFITNICSR